VATPPGGIEGKIAIFETFEDLQKAPPDSLQGKIAVLTERMGPSDSPTGYWTANTWRRKGASEAARRGALGFMLRSLATNDNRDPHSGMQNYVDGVPKIPAVALSGLNADQIERIAKRGLPIRIKFTLLPVNLPQATSWNVVGEIPGRVTPDEVVLVSAIWIRGVLAPGLRDVADARPCGIEKRCRDGIAPNHLASGQINECG